MCGIFGFLNYGKSKLDLTELTNSLAEESASRGTDACGIAYNNISHMMIYKRPSSAYSVDFKVKNPKSLIGHTRHATQGDVKKNYNNHPFPGKAGKLEFALTHNGVIMNDKSLRDNLNIPKTRVETDSYIAVQLIENMGSLNMDSLAYMAESVMGSFTFAILDRLNNIYIVRGDSPICMIHFYKRGIYVYASTQEILWRALISTELFEDLKNGSYEEVIIKEGEIVKISNSGNIEAGRFNYDTYWDYRYDWRGYGMFDTYDHIDEIKNIAGGFGYSEDDVDSLIHSGFTADEIEEYLYGVREV